MRALNRNAVPMPQCLVDPPPDRRYVHLGAPERAQIRASLLTLQGTHCAYCERITGDGATDGHIEHFRQQAAHDQLTLSWDNLYWSCSDEQTCGKHKDKCVRQGHATLAPYDPSDLIKPCADDPPTYLLFVVDGHVCPRPGLAEIDHRRASETIRVFNLDQSSYLRNSRQAAVQPYLRVLDHLISIAAHTVADYLRSELEHVSSAAFSSVIRQFLESFEPPTQQETAAASQSDAVA